MNQVQAALMDAIKSTDVDAFERLHDGYSDLEFRDGFGYTPLMVAAYLDMAFFCIRLLALSDANAVCGKQGRNALMLACANGSHASASVLQSKCAIDCIDHAGKGILSCCVEGALPDMFEQLAARLPPETRALQTEEALLDAIRLGDKQMASFCARRLDYGRAEALSAQALLHCASYRKESMANLLKGYVSNRPDNPIRSIRSHTS